MRVGMEEVGVKACHQIGILDRLLDSRVGISVTGQLADRARLDRRRQPRGADEELPRGPARVPALEGGHPAGGGVPGNWIQTVPGKKWFTILRLYGPLETWFDKTWIPGDIEPVDTD